jgi:hypothetical protein
MGHARPRDEFVSYVLKGAASERRMLPPPKTRVHLFPFDATLARFREVAAAGLTDRLPLMYWCAMHLMLLWPVRPASLASLRTDKIWIQKGWILL